MKLMEQQNLEQRAEKYKIISTEQDLAHITQRSAVCTGQPLAPPPLSLPPRRAIKSHRSKPFLKAVERALLSHILISNGGGSRAEESEHPNTKIQARLLVSR